MHRRIFSALLLSLTIILSVAAASQAQTPPLPLLDPAPLPPPPWRTEKAAWAAGGDEGEPELVEVPVAFDTFVASQYPLNWHNFAEEATVWFGFDEDAGELRALLRWNLPTIPYGYVGAAIYLPIAGIDGGATLTARAYTVTSDWQQPTWMTQPTVLSAPVAELAIGSEPKWYRVDATPLVKSWLSSGYVGGAMPNYGIELRGASATVKATRGMWSREAGDGANKPTPVLVIAYHPDRTPPSCTLNALAPVSTSLVQLNPVCNDAESGVQQIEIQSRDNAGPWQTIGTMQGYEILFNVFNRLGGHRYEFRVRGQDRSNNVSPWTPDGGSVTTIESTPPETTVLAPIAWVKVSSAASQLDTNVFSSVDPGPVASGIQSYERSYADASDGVWRPVAAWQDVTLVPGHRYWFRLRALDSAQNQGAWAVAGQAGAYVRAVQGQIRDVRGVPLANLPLVIAPQTLNPLVSDHEGAYEAYLADSQARTLSVSVAGYRLFGDTQISGGVADVRGLAHMLRSVPEPISNGEFALPLLNGAWSVTGPVARQPKVVFAADFGLRMGARPEEILAPAPIAFPPCFAMGPDGSQHLFWFQEIAGDREIVQANYTRRLAGRLDWEPIETLGTSRRQALSSTSPRCLLAVAPDATVHLIFNDFPQNVFHLIHRVRPPNSGWQAAEELPLQYQYPRATLVDRSGLLHLLFGTTCSDTNCQKAIPFTLYHAEWRAGQGWRSPTPVGLQSASLNSSGSGEASFILGADGRYHAIWNDYTGAASSRVVYSTSYDGRAWSAPQSISAPQVVNHTRVSLIQAPNGDLYAFWLCYTDRWRLYDARRHEGLWESPKEIKLPEPESEIGDYAVQISPSGIWQLAVRKVSLEFFSGSDLDALAAAGVWALGMEQIASATDSQAGYWVGLRPIEGRDRTVNGVSILTVPYSKDAAEANISQALQVPDRERPTLTWWHQEGHLMNASNGGNLIVGLTDTSGIWHPLFRSLPAATNTDAGATAEASAGSAETVDLSPWRGQSVTLDFRFDPQADPTAWVWLDKVYLSDLPLNAGVSIIVPRPPLSGSPLDFTVVISNHNSDAVTVPIEITWPQEWPLVQSSEAPQVASPGTARFTVRLEPQARHEVILTTDVPDQTPRTTTKLQARLLDPIVVEDYNPADNQAEITVIVDGLRTWLPLQMR